MIRKATLADFDHGYAICKRLYPDRPVHLGIPWVLDSLRRPDRLVLVSNYGVGVASLVQKYGFIPISVLDILAVLPGSPRMEAVRFLRTMIAWAKANGASRFSVGSDTGVDFGPLVRRIGGKANEIPWYYVPLQE